MSFELLSLETIQEIARQYGYWAVFFGITLESAGIPLPGETITLVGGFLAGSGNLNYWIVLVCAIAGATIGDNCGYWIGKVGGWPLLVKLGRIFRITEAQLVAVKREFSENAARAVFFGRFVALLRIFAGPMAGIAEMPYPQFLLCNFGGAALWATVMVTLSFFFGRFMPLERIISIVGQFGIIVLVIVVVMFLGTKWWEYRQLKQQSLNEQSVRGE
ncbi:MAG: DedA family protein [Symploca sp. SIO1B1]|nr:DedA family protein [Symploca sp. SIO1C2]NER48391.1 DedA family protein [Symploca sp. SIO1A3]NER97190.1 DedA family protein [Symploca sp. SIO1B1]